MLDAQFLESLNRRRRAFPSIFTLSLTQAVVILKSNDFPHVSPMNSRISRQNLEKTGKFLFCHHEASSIFLTVAGIANVSEPKRERRAAKRQVFVGGLRPRRGVREGGPEAVARELTPPSTPAHVAAFIVDPRPISRARPFPSAVGSPRANRQTHVSPVQDSFRGLVVAIVSGSASRLVGERSLRVNV